MDISLWQVIWDGGVLTRTDHRVKQTEEDNIRRSNFNFIYLVDEVADLPDSNRPKESTGISHPCAATHALPTELKAGDTSNHLLHLRWWWIETCMHMPPVRNQATTVIPNILWIQAYTTSIHGPTRSLYIQTPQMNVPCQQVTNHPPALPSIVLLFSSLSTDQREKAQLQSSWRAGNQ